MRLSAQRVHRSPYQMRNPRNKNAAFVCKRVLNHPYLEQDRSAFVWKCTPQKFGQELCHLLEKNRIFLNGEKMG